MAIPVPTRQNPGLEVPVFLDIESRVHRTINRALRRAVAEQTKGLVAAGRAGDTRGVQDRINAINFGPAAEEIRGELEVQALNAVILGAAQFVQGKSARNTKFVRDREIPIEVMQAVNQVVRSLDGSQTENVRRDVQVVANELEARLSEGSPEDARLLKQLGATTLGGFGAGQLATALNAAVNTGSTVQAGIAANIMTTRMVSFGALSQAGVSGIGRYQWNAVLDSSTCKFCRGMNGKTFQVGPALSQIRAIILAGDPETAKALSPWPKQTADSISRLSKLSNAKLQAAGFAVPPAHPSCRCVLSPVGTVPKSQIKGFIAQALRARQAKKPIADKLLQGVKKPPVVVSPAAPPVTGFTIAPPKVVPDKLVFLKPKPGPPPPAPPPPPPPKFKTLTFAPQKPAPKPPPRPKRRPPEKPLTTFKEAESTQQMWATGPKDAPIYTQGRLRTIHNPTREKMFRGKKTFAETGEEKTTHILGGGSGSGKGTVQRAGLIEGTTKNTIVVDSDAIKKTFPEYKRMLKVRDPEAAAFTHSESSFLARQLGAEGIEGNFHILLDGTGDGPFSKLAGSIKQARKAGNKVVGDFVNIPTDEAVLRALIRASGPEGRMVPEALIRDIHRNVSLNLDTAVKRRLFDRVKLWDNSGPKPILVMEQRGRKLVIRNKKLWNEFLEKGKENTERRILTKAQIKEAVDGGPEVAKRIVAEVRIKFNIPDSGTTAPKTLTLKKPPKVKRFPKINPVEEFDPGVEKAIVGVRQGATQIAPKIRSLRDRIDIPAAEFRAAKTYQGNFGSRVNKKLRDRVGISAEESKVVRGLDKAIERSATTREVVLYRGTKNMVSEGGLNFRPGMTFTNRGFTSWSFSRQTASGFSNKGKLPGEFLLGGDIPGVVGDRAVYRIRLKKGQKALFMDPFFEKEMILPRGLKYRVVSVEENVVVHTDPVSLKAVKRAEAAEGKVFEEGTKEAILIQSDRLLRQRLVRTVIDLEIVP